MNDSNVGLNTFWTAYVKCNLNWLIKSFSFNVSIEALGVGIRLESGQMYGLVCIKILGPDLG